MNIVDYCAEKAYNLYRQKYISDNQKKLAEIEKLNFKQKQDFIPEFTTDLKKNIANFLDDYKEDRDTVRKALTQILKSNFDNLQGNNIVDLSGKIDTGAITARLDDGIKKSLPDIYQKVQSSKQTKTQNPDEKSTKTSIDLKNPVKRKEYFQNLFTTYNSFKTFEEKLKFYCENIEDISELDTEKQKIRLNQYEIGHEIEKRFDKIENDNPKATEDELNTKNNEELIKMADEKNCPVEELKLIYNRKKLVELINIEPDPLKKSEYQENLTELDQQLDSLNNIEIIKEDNEIINEANNTSQNLFNNYSEEIDFVNIPLENTDALFEELMPEDNLFVELEDEFIFPESEEDSILPGLEDNELENEAPNEIDDLENSSNKVDIKQEDPFLDTLLDAELPKEKDLSNEVMNDTIDLETPNPSESNYKNPIMAGVQVSPEELEATQEYETEIPENPILKFLKNIRVRFTQAKLGAGQPTQNQPVVLKKEEHPVIENDLRQEDYTQNIEEKQGIFSRIKNALSKLVNKNTKKKIMAIGTAGDNTPSVVHNNTHIQNNLDYLSANTPSLEEQRAYSSSQLNKSSTAKTHFSIETNKGESLKL